MTALWDILGSEPFKGSKGHRQVSTTSCPAPRTLIDAQPEMKIVVCPLLQLPGSCQVSPTTPSGSKYPALPLQPSFLLPSRGILLQDLCLALLLSLLSSVSPISRNCPKQFFLSLSPLSHLSSGLLLFPLSSPLANLEHQQSSWRYVLLFTKSCETVTELWSKVFLLTSFLAIKGKQDEVGPKQLIIWFKRKVLLWNPLNSLCIFVLITRMAVERPNNPQLLH